MPSKIIRNRALYYQDVGQGYPILFGHSFLWDRKMWQPQVDFLSQHFRCLVPDLWSHGFSEEVPQRPYSLELLSEDYYHLMKSLNLDEFMIVGLSVGGMWGAQLALNHPKSVTGLVMLDSYLGEEPREKQNIYFEMLDSIERSGKFSEELIERVVPFFLSPKTLNTNQALVESFKARIRGIPHERLAGLIEMGYTIFLRGTLLDELPKLKVPTLVACGEDDLPRPKEESMLMAQSIPNAQLAIIPEAGHISNLEQPHYVNNLIFDFVSKIKDLACTPSKTEA